MSQENVETFKRAIEAANRQDIEAFLAEVHPEAEWPSPAILVALGGKATVYRGHEGTRKVLRDFYEAFGELEIVIFEIRDLDGRIVAIGRIRARGTESGADAEAPLGFVVDFRGQKAIRMRTYLDAQEALQAAGLSE